ncbi:MAG TPA: saccharopine dehydrogenase [Micromonosporaceae bacterium]
MLRSLWIRHETIPDEHRTPLVPQDAAVLVQRGVQVSVEASPPRAFPIEQYREAGCAVVPPGSWVGAPEDTVIVGLKQLPPDPPALHHRHVYFGHAYKRQAGSAELLRRFRAGGGELLDLEYLTDEHGRRLAAFGYWAGYIGAALAALHYHGRLVPPLAPTSRADLDAELAALPTGGTRALVLGALGRCGTGARDALATAGIATTAWDVAETRDLDRPTLRGHDLLVNAVLTTRPVPPFVTADDLAAADRRLRVIADVTCDVASPYHALPIYHQTTSWAEPVLGLAEVSPPCDVIAIDNLPSLLPREASVQFSADLLSQLTVLGDPDSAWRRCRQAFVDACRSLEPELDRTDA